MSGFGGSVKLTGEAAYRQALQAIAADLKNVAAQQKLTAASYDKSDTSLTALSKRSEELKNKLAAQQEKVKTLTAALKDYQSQQEKNKTIITNLQSQLDKEKATLEQIAKQYGTTSKEYQAQAKVVDDLEKELKELNTQYDKNETTIKKTQAALTSAEADVKKTGNQMQQLGKQAEEAGVGANKLGIAVDDSGKKARSAAEGGYTVFKNILANLATQVINKAIDGVKSLGRAVFDAGANFDSAMSKVQAVSGASAEDMAKLTAKAKEMGETTKFSASESAEALNYMAMAGWKTEDMLNGLEGVMHLAAASGSDLATTSDIVTDALTAMGYSAGDAGRLADVMAAASSNANTNVEMMGMTFQYAAPIVGALGYSMEDTAVAIGLMANAGIKGEKAGTALRSVLTRLSAPPAECAKAMEKLGISITDSEGKMKPLNTVIDDLRKAFDGLSEAEQTQLAKNIAGQEAMSGLLAIVNAAPADYNKLTQAVNKSTGAAEKMATTMQNNVGGKMTLLKSQLEGVYLTIWKKVEPVISKTIDSISRALKNVDWNKFGETAGKALEKVANGFKWLLEHKDLVINALKLMIAGFAYAKIMQFTKSISDSATSILALTGITKTATVATTGLAAAQGTATTATGLGTAAVKLFNAAWAANPIGLVVTALGLLVGGIVAVTNALGDNNNATETNSEAIRRQKKEIDENKSSWEELTKAQQESLNKGMTEMSYYEGLASELRTITDENGKVKQGYERRASFITNELANALGIEIQLQDGVVQGYGKIQTAIDQTIEKKKAEILLESQRPAYEEAIQKQEEGYKKLNELQAARHDALEEEMAAEKEYEESLDSFNIFWQQAAMNRLTTAREEVANANENYNAQTELLKGYAYTVQTYEGNMAAFHEGKYNEMTAATWDYVSQFQSAGDAQKAALVDQISTLEAALKYNQDMYKKTGDEIYNTEAKRLENQLNNAKENLKQYNATTENELKNNGKAWLENAATTLSKLSDKNVEFRKTADGMVQMYVDGVASGKPLAESKAEEITRGVLKEFDQKAAAEGAGKDVITGFTNGEGNFSLQNTAFRTARSFGSSILDNLKKTLGIGSPSRFTKQYGQWLLQGLGIGIEKEENAVIDQVEGFGENVLEALNGALEEGVSTNALQALQSAIPTEFNANIGANTSRMAEAAQSADKSLVGYFKQALSEMKIEMDSYEMGNFVDKTVTKLVYN